MKHSVSIKPLPALQESAKVATLVGNILLLNSITVSNRIELQGTHDYMYIMVDTRQRRKDSEILIRQVYYASVACRRSTLHKSRKCVPNKCPSQTTDLSWATL